MQVNWKKVGMGVAVADVVLLNAAVGWGGWKIVAGGKQPPQTQTTEPQTRDECGLGCQAEIQNQIQKLREEMTTAGGSGAGEPTVTLPPTERPVVTVRQPATAVKTKTRAVQYVTIPGSGSSKSLSWENLAGTDIYFDKADYPGLTEVYFEANVNLVNGNGTAYIRLYDATHGIGVDGSEIRSQSQTAAIVTSGKVNFWQGKNLIRVQAKTLTADTAVYSYGRLRIVTEN